MTGPIKSDHVKPGTQKHAQHLYGKHLEDWKKYVGSTYYRHELSVVPEGE
jgi:hypothetical protein